MQTLLALQSRALAGFKKVTRYNPIHKHKKSLKSRLNQ